MPAIRRIVTDLDRTVPMENVSTQAQLFKNSITPERIFSGLCSGPAILGVFLSCVGIYGLFAFMVTRRTNEFGIRMALGASSRAVAWSILRRALVMVGIGIGLPAIWGVVKTVRSYFFGIEAFDPVTVLGAVILLVAVTTCAAWLP